jgi:hypothetical protein
MSSETERLIHILLCEELGAEVFPDVTERVMKRALQYRQYWWSVVPWLWGSWSRGSWLPVATFAATFVVCVLAGWWTMGHRYPAPVASGSYKLLEATDVRRGAVLVTANQPASLVLGGYCQVQLEPNTALRIEGKQGAEGVHLEKGAVQCSVNPGVGAFAVRSQVGTVSVIGTSFSVKLLERKGTGTGSSSRKNVGKMAVAVTTGSVSVDYNGRVVKLTAGSQQVFGEEPVSGPKQPAPSRSTGRVTVTGVGKALRNARGTLDPYVANATVTVKEHGAEVVYNVYGWGGVTIAKQADGKRVDVNGYLGEKDGKKAITAASAGVKIIIVDSGLESATAVAAGQSPLFGVVRAAATSAEEAATVQVGQVVYKIVKDVNGGKVAREAKDKKVEIKGIISNRHGVKWIAVTSCKIVE